MIEPSADPASTYSFFMNLSELLQDLKFAGRALLRNRGFTAIALATLGLGIGANTAIFSFVDGVLLKSPPFPDSDRIVLVMEKTPTGELNAIATLNYLDWAEQNTVFDGMAAETREIATLTGAGDPIELGGAKVSTRYFDIFGLRAVLGRTFRAGDDELGNERVVILSDVLWRTQFGADPTVIGRSILLSGEPNTVIGVLPAGNPFERDWPKLWRPLTFTPENRTRNYHWMGSYAKLKPGVTLEQAKANMDTIGARIAQDFPDSNKGWGVIVARYAETMVRPELRHSLYLVMGAVGMILLIGCANLANLMLARGLAREREVSIRTALGASRWRIIRQFLSESLLLSVLGGAMGIGLGYAMMAALKVTLPQYALPREADVALDERVLLFTLGLSVVTGVLCGLFPALQASRIDLAGAMKQGSGGASVALTRNRMRSALVVAEVALAFVLLTGAGLLIRSFSAIQNVDTGFDSAHVITAGLPISARQFSSDESFRTYTRAMLARLSSLPGVKEVALTSALPLRGWGYGMPFQIAGRADVAPSNRPVGFFKMVTPSYFRALKMKLVRGRLLDDKDVGGFPPVVVINESFAKKHFSKEDPLGKRILVQQLLIGKAQLGPDIPWEVVGVIADEKVGALTEKENSVGMYVTVEQSPQLQQALLIQTEMDPAGMADSIRRAVREVNKDQSVMDLKSLEVIKRESMGDSRLRTALLSTFAAVALLLSVVGIYGVVAYSVVQRTREIGIRAALGASPSNIRRLVLQGGLNLIGVGLAVGTAGVFALSRLLSSLLFGVGERDPVTIAVVGAILAAAALLACYWPAVKATKVDPIIALRGD